MRMIGKVPVVEPRRVLVVQLRRIGDMLLGTPALRALQERFPGVEIDAVLDAPADEALLGNPRVRRVLVPPRRGLRAHIAFFRGLRRARYDWVFDFLSNPRSAQYTRFTGAPVRVGLDRPNRRYAYTHRMTESDEDRDLYAVDWRLRFLEGLGVPGAGRALELHADAAEPGEAERVARLLAGAAPGDRPVAAVAVGGGNPAKRYPTPLTAKVIDGLRGEGFVPVLTAGPGEDAQADRVRSALGEPVADLRQARIPTLAALYRRSAVYVGPDSATKHAAVAVGCPTVTLFGPGRPSSWNDLASGRDEVLLAPCPERPGCTEAECAVARHLGEIDPRDVVAAAVRRARGAVPAGPTPR